MLGNEILQFFHKRLCRIGRRAFFTDCAELAENVHHFFGQSIVLFPGSSPGLLFIFPVFRCASPGSLCLRGILIHLSGVKCGKIHMVFHSCQSDSTCKCNQVFQMLLFQLQKLDLLIQCFSAVKGRVLNNLSDFTKGKLQLTEQKNLLQGFQCCIVIQSVACIRVPGRVQKTDPVVILQRAYTHACQLAYLMNRHHGASLPVCGDSMICYDVTS